MTQIEKRHRHALEQTAEFKRILYTTEFALTNRRPATLLVTSAAQGEGKSLFAAALAATAAQRGNCRVVALDLNWYRPTLHRFFGLELRHSSQETFAADFSDLVCASGQDALDILTAPRDYVDHSLEQGQVFMIADRLIGQARNAYDFVVIDSAALFPTNRMMMDPVMLSGIADGVVMVVLAAATPRQQVRKAQKVMEVAGANILGVLSNHWKMSADRR